MTRISAILLAALLAGSLAALGLGLSAGGASGQSAAGLEFANWTSVDPDAEVASGTLRGQSIALSGSNITVGSVVDGSWPGFNRPEFAPPLATSDAIEFTGYTGHAYVLQFGGPVRDPVLHLSSLASTLEFPAGTQITRLSGDAEFTVSGNTVVGGLDLPSDDANGTVRLSGMFQSIAFSATPVYSPPSEDGVIIQVGAPPPEEPPPPPPPPPSVPPENVVAPEIRSAGDGSFVCHPGDWRNVTSAGFTYRWLVFKTGGSPGESVAETQAFTPDASVYGYPVACQATAAAPNGSVTATSAQVLFSSAGLNMLPPAYGDVRIRGIDVFQTVQPTAGARMFGYPPDGGVGAGFDAGLCGGGTPTSWRLVDFGGGLRLCDLQDRDAQYVNYQGVTLDRYKPTTAVVYVDVAGADPADPLLRYDLELSATRAGRTSLGEPVVKRIRNPARSDTPSVRAFERDSTALGDGNRHGVAIPLPSAWTSAGGSIRLEARLRFPDLRYGTAAYGTRQCDGGGCEANDIFTLNDVPFIDFPQLLIESLELRTPGQASLPAPATVLAKALTLFPGGARMVVSPYREAIAIDPIPLTATIPTGGTDYTCNNTTYLKKDYTQDAATRDCRWSAVAAQMKLWMAKNRARFFGLKSGGGTRRVYDVVMGLHDYAGEPGKALGTIKAVARHEPATADATPFFTATTATRPLTAAAHELGHILTAKHNAPGRFVSVGQLEEGTNCGNSQGNEPWPEVDPLAAGQRGRLQGVKFTPPFIGLRRRGSGGATVDGPYDRADGTTERTELYDLMSYCADLADDATSDGNAWLSARNWNRFVYELGELRARLAASGSAASARSRASARAAAFAVGVAGPGGGQITRVAASDGQDAIPAADPSSPFTLRSLASNGRVMLEAGVTVRPPSEGGTDSASPFAGPVARDAAAVELLRNGTLLDRAERSRLPVVRLTAPRRGTRVRGAGRLVVRWRASDPDNDPLDATIDFSADNGRTWRSVHQGPSRGRTTIPGNFLAGSRVARVRLSVSDGFFERTVTSSPFTAEGTRPRVEILTPQAGVPVRSGEKTALSGSAFDDRDRPLRGRALTWFAGQALLGRGERLRVRLPLSTRRLTLVARDRTGREGVARLPLHVEAPRLRIVALSVPLKVGRSARSMRVRIQASAPATLIAGARRFRVPAQRVRLTIPLPSKPAVGIVEVPFKLVPRSRTVKGAVRGTFSVART